MTPDGVLDGRDREAFERAAAELGGPELEVLDGLLGKGVHAEPGQRAPDVGSCGLHGGGVDEDELRRLGVDELAWLIRCLPPLRRLGLLRRIPPGDRWRVVRTSGNRSGGRALQSLQDVLVHPGLGDLDLVCRAGLHRYARELGDAGPMQARAAARALPPAWRGCMLTVLARFARPEGQQRGAP